jgi:NodT family efflux transporter outer membrane factor (OMF) lipoprotein
MTTLRSALCAFAALIFAPACETPPERVERELRLELPADWIARPGEAGAVDGHWWARFDDGDLADLVQRALLANPDLAVAAARVSEARALATLTGADLLPRLSGSLGGARTKTNFVGLPIPGGGGVTTNRFSSYDLGLGASWELDLWGRLADREEAALARADAAYVDLQAVRLSLVGAVLRAAFTVLEAQAQLELAERTATSWAENDDLVQRRYRKGLVPALQARQVASNLAGSRARIADRRRQLRDATLALSVLLGEPADLTLDAGEAFPELTDDIPPGLPVTLLSRRPDLVAAERRLMAAELEVEASRKAFYPSLTLTGSVGTSSDQLGDLLDGDFTVWNLAGNLVQPIFEGGRLRARVELADAQADAALAGFAATLLDALAEVESTLAADRDLAEVEAELVRASDHATAARDLAAERYRSGLVELIDLLDAQRTAQLAESELLSFRRLRLDNRVALHVALGGGFDAERDLALGREQWAEALDGDDEEARPAADAADGERR